MSRARTLVVGAAGFVGGHLIAELLGGGYSDVSAAKLPSERLSEGRSSRVSVHDVDVLDPASVDRLIRAVRPTRLVHLAAQSSVAQSWTDPAATFSLNVNGALHVLDAVRAVVPACRVLLVGSAEQYGRVRPEDLPVRETCVLAPENPYAVSKMAQEQTARLYVAAYGMDILMVRAFNHIGPGQSPAFVVSGFARQVARIERGLQPPVVSVGNLSARRDFTDVRDVVRAYALLLEKGRAGEVYNVGQGRSVGVDEVLDALISRCRVPVTVTVDPALFRPVDVPDVVADVTRLQGETGWTPRVPLAKSLDDTLAYWREHD